MTTNQENKLSMYQTVISYLNKHETMLNGLPHFQETFKQFKDAVNQIEGNKKLQETQISGITQQKNEIRDTLVDLAVEVANKVKVYATFTQNAVLKKEINYTDAVLRKAANNVLKDRAQIIHDKAQENLAQLGTYRVTQELLDKLADAIRQFADAIPGTRISQVGKKGITTNLRKTFTEIDVLLKDRLDALMLILRKDEAQFYTDYSNARMIVDLRGRGKNKEEISAKS